MVIAMIVQSDTCTFLWFEPMAGGCPATQRQVALESKRRGFEVIQLMFDRGTDDAVVAREEICEIIIQQNFKDILEQGLDWLVGFDPIVCSSLR